MKKILINLSTKRKKGGVAYACVFAVLLALMLTYYNASVFLENRSYMRKVEERVDALGKRLPAVHGTASAYDGDDKGLRKDLEFMNVFLGKKATSWTGLLTGLEQSLPEGVYLLQIRPDPRGERIDIAGVSSDLDKAVETVNMISGKGFSGVYLKGHSKDRDSGRVLFEISAVRRGGI